MSLAVFTDSTTAQASPAFTLRPTSGNSTNTISVNSCCAWSVMPTVAVSPLARTHSCDFVYFKSEGILLINFTGDYADGANSQSKSRPLLWLFVNRLRHDGRRITFAANFNFNLLSHSGRNITHADANAK